MLDIHMFVLDLLKAIHILVFHLVKHVEIKCSYFNHNVSSFFFTLSVMMIISLTTFNESHIVICFFSAGVGVFISIYLYLCIQIAIHKYDVLT